MKILKKLDDLLSQYNAKYRIISTDHLRELHNEIESLNRRGKINPDIYTSYLTPFQYTPPESDSSAQSVIMIAMPQNISIVLFKQDGKTFKAVIPPAYFSRKVRKTCIDILSELFGSNIESKRAFLPLKLLTVRSGLGRYGRNLLCYVDSMGSFARLEAFYIPYQPDRDDWKQKEKLPQCENCNKCIMNCPTQCIQKEEIMMDAGRCITHFNENRGAFPIELHPKAHNAIVGCVRCQTVCPVNRPLLKEKTTVETFSEEETGLILDNKPDASKALTEKLTHLDLDEYKAVLSRNLKALIK
jgi:epoxyqueuosine reductase